MTEGAFRQSLDRSKRLVNELKLRKASDFGTPNNVKLTYIDGVSDEFKKASQQEDYFLLYQTAIKNFDYDILMKDESIFQFSFENVGAGELPKIRYSFFQNPQLYKTYEDYLNLLKEQEILDDEDFEEVGQMFLEDYSQFLNEMQVNTSNTSIRFDVDGKEHEPLVHASAHFHFGHVTNVRIPSSKVISPLSFVLFIIKHIYYQDWKSLIESNNQILLGELNNQKNGCIDIRSEFPNKWIIQEEIDYYVN